ncbi:MAG: hypothetical protein KDK04_06845 [Candidatus Competibacteraceae bacterium]|nr:hypothetical protein [Candidatus Competibacteraceae bacterium]MCB1811424.1 hypothetical protein [Candidatus Competibacteraceae bacterium]
MELLFQAMTESQAGPKWQALFERLWPAYKRWFLSEGERARPLYLSSVRALRQYMPELLPTYERLVELAGGSDLAARFLSLYCPPPYLSGCSQAIWPGPPPLLIRNYDYNPLLFEGLILHTTWNGRRVIATSDCLWGVVDGINDAGLAVSLTFGGRRVVGQGFGVPVILRYILEFCTDCTEAAEVLTRIPTHMAYNISLLDRSGNYATVFIAPDREPVVSRVLVTTNHQREVEWHQHAQATASVERERFLKFRLRESGHEPQRLIQAFLRSPVYSTAYGHGFGTLYTAILRPDEGVVDYLWPTVEWRQSLTSFQEDAKLIRYLQSI